jgi:xylulokinase
MAVYLGFDSSTQSLSAVAIEIEGSRRSVIYERCINFDEDFPDYNTQNGILPHDDPQVARSSPLLWAEALDRLMGIIVKESGIPVEQIRAISGSGQQHGSVYLNAGASSVLGHLDPKRSLVEQIRPMFSRESSPIWMDSSTTVECAEITEAVGGRGVLPLLTGSRAFERFTGPQIRKYFKQDPEGYARTDKIHLVSSYMASLLSGKHAPIDPGDGAGMNLMDLGEGRWSEIAVQATAPELESKLPELMEPWAVVGELSPYWVKRYNFPEKTRVISWSGDNPSTLIGIGLLRQGDIGVSLGTSTTLFGFMSKLQVDPTGSGHVFGCPTGDFMSLICFENGSLAREQIRQEHGLDWEGFSRALRSTQPGNKGRVLLPWFRPEITPTVHAPGARRYGLDPKDGPANVRAVVEGQMMALAIHSQWMGVPVRTVHATGGAAGNREILRVMADVLNAEVYQFETSKTASLGAALRAYHADQLARGEQVMWEEVVAGFSEPVKESRIVPDVKSVELYTELKSIYSACEAHALRGGADPSSLLATFSKRKDPQA